MTVRRGRNACKVTLEEWKGSYRKPHVWRVGEVRCGEGDVECVWTVKKKSKEVSVVGMNMKVTRRKKKWSCIKTNLLTPTWD